MKEAIKQSNYYGIKWAEAIVTVRLFHHYGVLVIVKRGCAVGREHQEGSFNTPVHAAG